MKQKYPGRETEVDALAAQDPSGQNKYLEWMAKWVIGEGNDASFIVPLVQRYHTQQGRLPKEFRDITKLDPFGVEWAVERAEGSKTHQQKRQDVQKGAPLIAETPEFKIYEIKNKEASCALGRGTQWCITMKEEQHYEDYVAQGVRFFFIIEPNGTKWAVSTYPDFGAIEIFDAEDNRVTPSKLPPGSLNVVYKAIGYTEEAALAIEKDPPRPGAGRDFVFDLRQMIRNPYSKPETIDQAMAHIQHLPLQFQGLEGLGDALPTLAARPVLGPIARSYIVNHGSNHTIEVFFHRPDITRDEIDAALNRFATGTMGSLITALLANPSYPQDFVLDIARRVGMQSYMIRRAVTKAKITEAGWNWIGQHLKDFDEEDRTAFLAMPGRPREITDALLNGIRRIPSEFVGDVPGEMARHLIETDPFKWNSALTMTPEIPVDEAVQLTLSKNTHVWRPKAVHLMTGLLMRDDLTKEHVDALRASFTDRFEDALARVSWKTANPAVIDAAVDTEDYHYDEHNNVHENKNLTPEQVRRLWHGKVQRNQHTTINRAKFLKSHKDKLTREIVQEAWQESPANAIDAIPDLIPSSALRSSMKDAPYPIRKAIVEELRRRGQEAQDAEVPTITNVEFNLDDLSFEYVGYVTTEGHVNVDVTLSTGEVVHARTTVNLDQEGGMNLIPQDPELWRETPSWLGEEYADDLLPQIGEKCTDETIRDAVMEKLKAWKKDRLHDIMTWEETDSGEGWTLWIAADPFSDGGLWYTTRTNGPYPDETVRLRMFNEEDQARSFALDLAEDLKAKDRAADEEPEEEDDEEDDESRDLDRDASLRAGFGVLLSRRSRSHPVPSMAALG